VIWRCLRRLAGSPSRPCCGPTIAASSLMSRTPCMAWSGSAGSRAMPSICV